MSGAVPTPQEEEALYALLTAREAALQPVLIRYLTRLEKSLYARLTVEEIEKLKGA